MLDKTIAAETVISNADAYVISNNIKLLSSTLDRLWIKYKNRKEIERHKKKLFEISEKLEDLKRNFGR